MQILYKVVGCGKNVSSRALLELTKCHSISFLSNDLGCYLNMHCVTMTSRVYFHYYGLTWKFLTASLRSGTEMIPHSLNS